jgi:hypothetical protein
MKRQRLCNFTAFLIQKTILLVVRSRNRQKVGVVCKQNTEHSPGFEASSDKGQDAVIFTLLEEESKIRLRSAVA